MARGQQSPSTIVSFSSFGLILSSVNSLHRGYDKIK